MFRSFLTSTVLLSSLSLAAPSFNLNNVKRSVSGPVISQNFPDPSIINVAGRWYSFATNGAGVNVQMAQSDDFVNWSLVSGWDAMPTVPSWVDQSAANIWAPDVAQLDDGTFVLYFAGQSATDGARHCVGAATSGNVEGPYTPLDSTIACPLDQGGAIDISGFKDYDGTRYVVYKIDGNSIGNGGLCGNGVAPIVPTPIMLQQVDSDGVTLIGDAEQILDRDDNDGPLVEAPSLLRTADGQYVLFFSSSCYSSTYYDVTYATASSVHGPFTKYGPLLVTGDYGLTAPGGASAVQDGSAIVFHADNPDVNTRSMWTAEITIDGNTITA